MVNGKLEPTLEEQMKKSKQAFIHVTIFHINHGTVGEGTDAMEFSVDANPKTIVVRIKKGKKESREVLYDVEDLVRESVEMVEKDEVHRRIADKIAEQKAKREREKK